MFKIWEDVLGPDNSKQMSQKERLYVSLGEPWQNISQSPRTFPVWGYTHMHVLFLYCRPPYVEPLPSSTITTTHFTILFQNSSHSSPNQRSALHSD